MGKIPGSAHVNLSLGLLVVAGGAVGYARKGSKISLVAGLTLGSLLIGSGYMIGFTDMIYEGHILGASTSGIMAAGMAPRVISTGKFMPAGVVASLGIVAAAYNYHKAQEWAPSSSSSSLSNPTSTNSKSL
jgi:uncharacterized membrane protein (UPF0136 family)